MHKHQALHHQIAHENGFRSSVCAKSRVGLCVSGKICSSPIEIVSFKCVLMVMIGGERVVDVPRRHSLAVSRWAVNVTNPASSSQRTSIVRPHSDTDRRQRRNVGSERRLRVENGNNRQNSFEFHSAVFLGAQGEYARQSSSSVAPLCPIGGSQPTCSEQLGLRVLEIPSFLGLPLAVEKPRQMQSRNSSRFFLSFGRGEYARQVFRPVAHPAGLTMDEACHAAIGCSSSGSPLHKIIRNTVQESAL